MPNTADIKKTLADSTPLYAVAGAGDLAVEKLREVPAKLAALRVDPKTVQDKVNDRLAALSGDVRTLPEKAQTFALTGLGKANDAYEDLAKRGKVVVGRVRRQKASQDLKADMHRTAGKVKAVETTAKRSAANTQRAAKAAATSAGQTAKTAERAARDAGDKIG